MFRIALCALLSFGLASAQAPKAKEGEGNDLASRYQKLQKDPEPLRVALAAELASVPGPRGVALVKRELETAKTRELKLALLRGLAKYPRVELVATIAEQVEISAPDTEMAAAVGAALAGLKADGVSALQELTEKFATGRSNHQLRQSVFQVLLNALGSVEHPSAHAALAALARKGAAYDRWRAVLHLQAVAGDDTLGTARRELLTTDYAPAVAEALRQIAQHDAAGFVAAAQQVAARLRGNDEPLRAALAEVIGSNLRPELFEVFFACAAVVDPTLQRGLKPIAAKVSGNAELGQFVLARADKLATPGEQLLAARLLGTTKAPAVTAMLIDLAQERDPLTADTAIELLGKRGDPDAIPVLRKLLRSGGGDRRRQALVGLHELLRKEAEWRTELRGYLGEAELKLVAIDLLADAKDEEFAPQVYALLTDPDWRTRAAAYDFCRRLRAASALGPLIDRLGKEQDRMRQDVVEALTAITGQSLATDMQWKAWWLDNKDTFKVAAAPAPAPQKKRADPDAGSTRTYYSMPVVSANVMFVIDRSGSMQAQIGTGGGTRLDEAKRQLVRVLGSTPLGHKVGVIAFETGVQRVQDKLLKLDEKGRAGLIGKVKALTLGGGTNVHDGLQAAFGDPDVDTIYLLTDGDPSAGPITDPAQLRAAVAKWNRLRRIRIHCISVGTDSKLLEGLAADAGGHYISVR